jgi:hypothetical protein
MALARQRVPQAWQQDEPPATPPRASPRSRSRRRRLRRAPPRANAPDVTVWVNIGVSAERPICGAGAPACGRPARRGRDTRDYTCICNSDVARSRTLIMPRSARQGPEMPNVVRRAAHLPAGHGIEACAGDWLAFGRRTPIPVRGCCAARPVIGRCYVRAGCRVLARSTCRRSRQGPSGMAAMPAKPDPPATSLAMTFAPARPRPTRR